MDKPTECPLRKDKCLQKRCMWYVKSPSNNEYRCAIAWIGENNAYELEELED